MSAAQMGIDRQTSNLKSQAAMYGLGEAADTKAYGENRDAASDQIARTALERKTLLEERAFNKPEHSNSKIVNMEVSDGQGGTITKAVRQFETGPRSGDVEDLRGNPIYDGSETRTGTTPSDLMSGTVDGKKPLSVEAAGKAAMVESAIDTADQLDTFMFGSDSEGGIDFTSPNRTNIATMTLNPMGGGVPGTEGRTAFTLLRNAVEGKIRIESGAAVPEPEVTRALQRFQPSVLDSDQTIMVKRQLLRDYFSTAKSLYDPQGNLTMAGKLFMDKADAQVADQETRTPGIQDTVQREGKPEAVQGANGKWYYKVPKQGAQ